MRVVETYEKDAIQVEDEFFNDDESLSAFELQRVELHDQAETATWWALQLWWDQRWSGRSVYSFTDYHPYQRILNTER